MSPICLRNSIPLKTAIAIAMVWTVFSPPCSGQTQQPEASEDQVLRYLDNKGLQRLAILHQSKQLAAELDGGQRDEIAEDLANRYRQYFFSDFNEDSASDFFERASRLSKTYPAINTPNFRLALSHAEYIQAERQFRRWWSSSAPDSGRRSIIDAFEKLQRQLASHIRSDESRQEQLISQIALDPATRHEQQQIIDQIEVRLLHGHYLFAWTNYFLFVMSSGDSNALLRQAELSFFRALRIEQPGPIEKIDDKWLDFSAPISGRALLGLAAVYTALERNASARFCFDKAETKSAPQFERAELEFNALAFSKQWQPAAEFARARDNKASALVSFWIAVGNAGYSSESELPELKELRQLGLLGIARKFDFDKLRQFAVTEEIDFAKDSYQKKWIEALVQYHINESSNSGFDEPLKQITDLTESAADIPPSDLARIRCIAALMHYKRGELEQANQQVKNVGRKDLAGDQQLALRLDWLNVLIQLKRASVDTMRQAEAIGAINNFVDQYPDSEMYQLAMFERFKLTNRLLPSDQALKKLQAVTIDHDFYSEAQFEIVDCLRRCWAEQSSADIRNRLFDELVVADRNFRALPDVDTRRQLDSLLILTDVAIRSNKTHSFVSQLLGQAEKILDSLSEKDPQQQVVSYFRFRQAKKSGELQTAADLAQSLAIDSGIKQHRLAALAFVADLYDQEPKTKLQMSKARTYELLVAEFGSTVERLSQSKNARVAATRLVESYLESNTSSDKARQLNDKLLKVSPNQANLLLNSARISMMQGKPDMALNVWRKIVRSARPGDDLWFESKLGIIKCLMSSNREHAVKVLKQTVSLAGEIPDRWTAEFEEMNRALNQADHNNQ